MFGAKKQVKAFDPADSWRGYRVIIRGNGSYFNNGEWIDDWRQAERYYGPLHNADGARAVLLQLRENGQACFLAYIPGSVN